MSRCVPSPSGAEFLDPSEPSPAGPASGLRGIAALAAEADPEESRNGADYRWLDCRSVLNRSDARRAPFEWSVNPYRGCEFGCAYCYARYTHEFMEHRDPFDFERIIYMKRGAARRLAADLDSGKIRPGETIAIGAATDPYQPAEKRHGVTRSILEVFARRRGFRMEIITKSDLILRDLDLLKTIDSRHKLAINISIMTADARLARRMEPRTVVPARRFEALARLREAGLKAGVFVMPVLPGITDGEAQLDEVARLAAEAGAGHFLHQVLFLTAATRRRFDAHLAREFPELAARYRALYAGGSDAPDAYRKEISARMRRLRERHGLPEGHPLGPGKTAAAKAAEEAREEGQLAWV